MFNMTMLVTHTCCTCLLMLHELLMLFPLQGLQKRLNTIFTLKALHLQPQESVKQHNYHECQPHCLVSDL